MAEPTHLPGMTPRVAARDVHVEAFVIEQMRLAHQPIRHLRLETDLAVTTAATPNLSGWLDSAIDRAGHDSIPLLQVRRSSTDIAGDLSLWASVLESVSKAQQKALDLVAFHRVLADFGGAVLDLKHARDAGWAELTSLFETQNALYSVWLIDAAGVKNAVAAPEFHEAFQQLLATYATDLLREPNRWGKQPEIETRVLQAAVEAASREFAPPSTAGWPDEGLPVAPPKPTAPLEAARARRDAILADGAWHTSEGVALKARGTLVDSNSAQYASRLRREGRLFGVRVRGQYLHPEFQFQKNGEVHPSMAKLIGLLPMSEANWTAAFWLFQPTHALDGRRPVDIFPADPQRVIDFAEREFRGDHGRW